MTTPWLKAVRDLWHERARSGLVVLAIALGIAAFGSVLSTYAILMRELDADYLATNPASATLWTDAVDAALIADLGASQGVGAAEAQRSLSGQIKAGPAEWRNLHLFVVEDFADVRIGKLKPERGAWPPAVGEILIERDALEVARASIGDGVTVRTANGEERPLLVSGSVHDVGQAQARMEQIVYGYVTLETLTVLGEEPYLDQLEIVVAEKPFDEEHVRSVAAEVERWLVARGHPVRRIDVPDPGRHPHADLMGLLLLIQACFGLFVSVLSGSVVVNLFMGLMASQVRQIGVMKATGATRAMIARIYFGQALALGAAAWLIALPLGIWGGRVLCRYMGVFLNFDIDSFAVPAWVYLLEAIVALLVPLVAAACPVWKGSRMSVRDALDDHEVGRGSFGNGALDRALAGMGGAARPVLLAVRNGFRRRARLALTVATLAVGGLFFLTALNVRASMIHTLDRLFGTMRYDLTVNLRSMYPLEKLMRATKDTPGILQAEGWIGAEGSIPRAADGGPAAGSKSGGHLGGSSHGHLGGAARGDRFAVVGLPAETSLVAPNLVEGRALRSGDVRAVVLNTRLAARMPRTTVGDEVSLQIGPALESWHVVGIASEPFAGPVAYLPRDYFERAGHVGMAKSLRLVLDEADPESIAAVKTSLDQQLEREGVRASSSASKADRRRSYDEHMLMLFVFLIVVSGVIAGVGGLGLMTTMSLNVLERRREMGVLRAVGASPSAVAMIVVVEATVIALLAWALAAAAAWPLGRAVGDHVVGLMLKTGLDFVIAPLGLVTWLAISVILAVVASALPAWRASRRPVREALSSAV